MQDIEINFQMVYPEIYYKLQPHVRRACDHMDRHEMPTQDLLNSLSDGVHSDVLRMNPEVADYAYGPVGEMQNSRPRRRSCCCGGGHHRSRPAAYQDPTPMYSPYSNPGYGTNQSGLLNDLIGIMLLNEFYRRRR